MLKLLNNKKCYEIYSFKNLNFLFFFIIKYSFLISSYLAFFKNLTIFNNSKQLFINFNYFYLLELKNSKMLNLIYLIQFKKQNSLLKRKFSYLNNLNPSYYKKFYKKTLKSIENYDKVKLEKNTSSLNYVELTKKNSLNNNFVNGKKKLKKVILLNRKYLSNFQFNVMKNSKKLSNSISLLSKYKLNLIILKLEFSFSNSILKSNLIKSFNDILTLLKTSSLYLNRKIIKNVKTTELHTSDLVELNITYKYFNYMYEFKITNKKFFIKLKNKLFFKLKRAAFGKKTNEKGLVQKTNALYYNKIPNYLEVDFFTLSFFVVYKNLNLKSLSINLRKMIVFYLFKLYN